LINRSTAISAGICIVLSVAAAFSAGSGHSWNWQTDLKPAGHFKIFSLELERGRFSWEEEEHVPSPPTPQPFGLPPASMTSISREGEPYDFIWLLELSAILPGLWLLIWPLDRMFRAPRAGFCGTCGYDMRATPHRCPECGEVPFR
jgi:hypothetical protein